MSDHHLARHLAASTSLAGMAAFALLAAVPGAAFAACPAPSATFSLSGNAVCLGPTPGTGDQLRAGDSGGGGVGAVAITGGQVVTLDSGPNPGEAPFAVFGRSPGASGTLSIAGPGSTLQLNGANNGTSLQIGREGTGSATVGLGGAIRLFDNTAVPGSHVNFGESIFVGRNGGTGTLTVNGGTVAVDSASGAYLFLGEAAGNGTVNASSGSVITLRDRATGANGGDAGLVVGRNVAAVPGTSAGTLVLNSATLAVQSDGNAATLAVGRENGTVGTMTATGATITLDGLRGATGIVLGRDTGATGTMTLNGGSVTVRGLGTAAADAVFSVGVSGSGTAIVDATAVQVEATRFADIIVGRNAGSVGTLTLRNGANVSVTHADATNFATATVGRLDGSAGTLTVTGASTTLGFGGVNTVLQAGREFGSNGTIRVENGASVTLGGTGDNNIMLGRFDGASGTLDIASGGQVTVAAGGALSRVHVGAPVAAGGAVTAIADAGAGLLRVSGTGSRLTADQLIVGAPLSQAGTTTDGGTVIVSNGGRLDVGTVRIGQGGVVSGSGGTIAGSVVLDGGTLAPGASPGTMSILGDLVLTSGTLAIEIGGRGAGQFDVLNVGGVTQFLGGTILFDFVDGFAPDAGESFAFLDTQSLVLDPSVTFAFAGLAPGFAFSVGGSDSLVFTALTDGVSTTSVPEPLGLAFLGVGLAGLAAARRWRG
jgi:hypothetical protein